ncbi:WD repeat-containing 6 [Pelobates cultripes]|uniref:tRNA (34-2'-O)-methyltransferase regulator WDR6 n=1 Tax=Pelobates cultripes TaxID=61616 RepID=A0AAD1SU60_PELCU|nr:WD repeat-containing 6 [Pelobates cultripes]
MDCMLLVAPITALEFIGEYLLAGEGPYLTVYSVKDKHINSQRIRQNVLHSYTIHGIKLCDSASSKASDVLLCVFGSKGLIVLQLNIMDQGLNLLKLCDIRELNDWIWDVQWLGDDLQPTCYLGLAMGHNSVILYDYLNGEILKEVHCSEKCILYSAHFCGVQWEDLIMVSGTVFNQLVVWCPSDQTNVDGRVEPRRRISGHNGVIFSIFYNKGKGILVSASDDRSLRVWDVGDLSASTFNVQCLHVLYGHQARVWSVRLLSDYIISIGEDSACIVWDYAGGLIHNFKGHKGRGIRAVAVKEEPGWIATGGADAAIRIWQIKGKSFLPNGLQALEFSSSFCNGSPKAIKMLDTNFLVVMTDQGSIYTYNYISKQWNFILEDNSYASYSLLDIYKSKNCVLCAIGNITGNIKIFPISSALSGKDLKLHQGKVHSLTWASSPCQSSDTCSLFSSGSNGVMVWIEVICLPGHVLSVTEKLSFALPTCKQRWHTCIAFLPQKDFIVVGDRRGSLMLFPINCPPVQNNENGIRRSTAPVSETQNDPSFDSVTAEENHTASVGNVKQYTSGPVSTLFGIHGKLGVTSVMCHDGFVYTTGRDGLYRQLMVTEGQLVMLRKLKACKGMEWIESISFTSEGNLYILGFQSTDFVVWSMRTNEKIHCVPCGGGHRSWSYREDENQAVFAYIKSGDIFVYQSQKTEKIHSVLKEPMHGRELTCVRYVGTIMALHTESLHILITSSEDTTVNIFSFSEVTKEVHQLATLNDHLSSVRTMALANTKQIQGGVCSLSTLLFTAGGRAQIECYRVQVMWKKDETRLSCQVFHLASHRLDKHWERMKNKHKSVKMDPETRYMSIVPVTESQDKQRQRSGNLYVFLAAACSDGSVRFFLMCEGSKRLVLAAQSFYHQRCVLKVDTLIYQSNDKQRILLSSAATDGQIAFWDINRTMEQAHTVLEDTDCLPLEMEPLSFTVSAHQSGINSLHILETKHGHHLVASGGDDNSLHVCLLTVDQVNDPNQGTSIQLLKEFSVSSAHSAHVTGLRILQEDLLASVSVDQRLTLWSLDGNGLRHLSTRFSHVADVSELDCWVLKDKEEYVCVLCGQGLEIVKCMR